MLSLAIGSDVYWVESHLSYQPNGDALVWRGKSPFEPKNAHKNIDGVEVSFDGGKSFRMAHLLTQIGIAYCGIDESRKCFATLNEALVHAKSAGLRISERPSATKIVQRSRLASLLFPM